MKTFTTDEEFLRIIGARIQEKRAFRGWSQTELAEKVGTSRTHIYRIESATNAASILMYRKISTALEIPLSELVEVK